MNTEVKGEMEVCEGRDNSKNLRTSGEGQKNLRTRGEGQKVRSCEML